ncbi:YceD family protein [Mesorhizobium xinjiangense]|uniref:YceD family protein n=1 Tax=Mesorhizobium xinjiangense TaxID=2678685 RepID=UPI0012ECC90A|nr:DUF177 domain-containing protein [Mesorhizobium xinjiangense]
MKPTSESPVSFRVNVARLPQKGLPVRIEAAPEQLEALAREHELVEVDRFTAELKVEKWKRDGVKVSGTVEADIVQACVATLEPLRSTIREAVEAVFVPENSKLARREALRQEEIMVDPDGPDLPETFEGETIDVGALAEEFMELGIDPYPRAPGASGAAVAVSTEPEAEKAPESPFAKLRQLKKNS